jgi:hypothetical protein
VQEVHGGLLQEAQQAQHAGGYQGVIDRCIIPLLGRKKVQDVKRPDIAGLMEKLAYKPTEANKAFSVLRKMFNLAECGAIGRTAPIRAATSRCTRRQGHPPHQRRGHGRLFRQLDKLEAKGWRTTSSRWRSACNSSSPPAAPKSARSNGLGGSGEPARGLARQQDRRHVQAHERGSLSAAFDGAAPGRLPYVLPSPTTRPAPDHGRALRRLVPRAQGGGVPHVGTHGIRHRSRPTLPIRASRSRSAWR